MDDPVRLISSEGANLIVNVTGNPAVEQFIAEHKKPSAEVLGGEASKLLWNVVQHEAQMQVHVFQTEKLAKMVEGGTFINYLVKHRFKQRIWHNLSPRGWNSGNSIGCNQGMLKKAASGVLALLPCSRTPRMLRASTMVAPCGTLLFNLRPCWTNFFEHSLQLIMSSSFRACIGHESEIFNRPISNSIQPTCATDE